ncbi:MAG: NAD(P)/FAD-dependent oxidoreductase [Deltaproteobacteria bacterium]|nr:NAD(P)/FAD-dependent oxidoreductase [Candidatus Zymogenaceae bacterium]
MDCTLRESYDVVVVGAGFGGTAAAHHTARHGLSTLVIERAENIGEKIISGLTIPIYGFLFGPGFIRDGTPPIERPVDGIINYIVTDIDREEIVIDDTLRFPKPFAPIFSFGYNAYCADFCQWQADEAVRVGAEVVTKTVVSDLIIEGGSVRGVVLEDGRNIAAKIVINAEGSQGLLSVKAGIRKKYPPRVISLADTYDYTMKKGDVDRIFGHSIRFLWAWDEQNMAPPLGYGNGLMVWPYGESLHFMQDQCLAMDDGTVQNLKKRFETYHKNVVEKLPWWRDDVEAKAELRAHTWQCFEIFVGLDDELRAMPLSTGGMLLVGDAGGLESTELCDGVPAAWFSAEIAGRVAREAIEAGDVSEDFLSRYDREIRNHPIIAWSITAPHRYLLRNAQQDHDLGSLRKYVHAGWGFGALAHTVSPLFRVFLSAIRQDPRVLTSWVRMFFRNYRHWHHSYSDDVSSCGDEVIRPGDRSVGEYIFIFLMWWSDLVLTVFWPVLWTMSYLFVPFAFLMKAIAGFMVWLYEPLYVRLLGRLDTSAVGMTEALIRFTVKARAATFGAKKRREP